MGNSRTTIYQGYENYPCGDTSTTENHSLIILYRPVRIIKWLFRKEGWLFRKGLAFTPVKDKL